jgi:hypothetical protein
MGRKEEFITGPSISHLPVVHFGFTHPKFFTGGEATILTGIDVTSGMVSAAQLPSRRVTPHLSWPDKKLSPGDWESRGHSSER